jgi:hypothetical protein
VHSSNGFSQVPAVGALGRAISIDDLVSMICVEIKSLGRVGKKAIPEQYDLLRMAQLIVCGYMKPWTMPVP